MKNLKKILAAGLVLSSLVGFGASVASFAASEITKEEGEEIIFCHRDFYDDFPDLCDPDYKWPSEEGKFDLDGQLKVEERTGGSFQTFFESDEQMLRHVSLNRNR